MKCPKCGTQNQENADFCSLCYHPFKSSSKKLERTHEKKENSQINIKKPPYNEPTKRVSILKKIFYNLKPSITKPTNWAFILNRIFYKIVAIFTSWISLIIISYFFMYFLKGDMGIMVVGAPFLAVAILVLLLLTFFLFFDLVVFAYYGIIVTINRAIALKPRRKK
ncbi:hypothetical protein LCGC14_2442090 [marine sediment metagenome]|uniref:Zinc-ribbon domain-containing protein n=1 Tax=marine sediment metagenome TaxID=412755 RepID=A0A0F9ECP7_9ZZZZ